MRLAREANLMLAGLMLSAPILPSPVGPRVIYAAPQFSQASPKALSPLSPVEVQALREKLNRLERQSIQYFMQNRHANGLVMDRAANVPWKPTNVHELRDKQRMDSMASIAATGYGLASWVMAVEKGIMTRNQARDWALQTLKFVEKSTPEIQKGWMSHFMDAETGRTYPGSEISSIDTALFFAGAMVAGEYFGGEVQTQVQKMFDKVDFKMMLTNDGAQPNKKQFSHGFLVVEGKRHFIETNWDTFSEGILIPLLAMGSTTYPVPDSVWTEGWNRDQTWEYDGKKNYRELPLFTYFYPAGFVNLKERRDSKGADLWAAARQAVQMQLAYCKNKGYPDGLFGLSACDGPQGYRAYQTGHPEEDKTIAPTAILACLPFAEREVHDALKQLEELKLTDQKFGLIGAYNTSNRWQAKDAVGIDVGSTLMMLDAYDKGTIHRMSDRNPVIRRALERAGFIKKQ